MTKQVPAFNHTGLASQRVSPDDILETNCRFIYEYWESLRGDRFAPSWNDFDLMQLPPRNISFTRVVDICTNPFDLVYRFWGTGLINMHGGERTGKSLAKWPSPRVQQAMAEYETIIRERAPYAFVYNAKTANQATPLYAPGIRLPLSDDGETVDKIITFADYYADPLKWREFYEKQK